MGTALVVIGVILVGVLAGVYRFWRRGRSPLDARSRRLRQDDWYRYPPEDRR